MSAYENVDFALRIAGISADQRRSFAEVALVSKPTGSVDTKTATQIMDLFNQMNCDLGLTIVIVTHDQLVVKQVNRVIAIRDGRTSSEMIRRKSYAEQMEEIEQESAVAQEETHDEYAVMDKAGRIQVPANYLEALGMQGMNKVKLALEDHRIILESPERKSDKEKS